MIEHPKPVSEKISGLLQKRPAHVQREAELKTKISTIIKDHPNKSLRVIRGWLHDEPGS